MLVGLRMTEDTGMLVGLRTTEDTGMLVGLRMTEDTGMLVGLSVTEETGMLVGLRTTVETPNFLTDVDTVAFDNIVIYNNVLLGPINENKTEYNYCTVQDEGTHSE